MGRTCILLLAEICVLALLCTGQKTKSGNPGSAIADNGNPRALSSDADVHKGANGLRNVLNATETEEEMVPEELQGVEHRQEIDELQSRSSKDVSLSTNSRSATFPRDCADVMSSGETTSGVYTVYVGRLKRPVSVYCEFCDMTTDDGGWTVFQRRKDGSVRFDRHWKEYVVGFGNVGGEFWLGNDVLHLLTKTRRCQLRIDLEAWDNTSAFAQYDDFKVASACDDYKLISVGAFCGNAGDSLTKTHVGMKFSTFDKDNDIVPSQSCAVIYKGAWWYSGCHHANLNGLYLRGAHTSYADGVNWLTWTGQYYSLKFVEMKIRPIDI